MRPAPLLDAAVEEALVPMSALRHYLFCQRQCALIHVERLWAEDVATAEGRLLHERADSDRPGRNSLALDLMEELRPVLADRLVLSLINRGQLKAADFIHEEAGAVRLTDDARKAVLVAWQERKRESLRHPFLGETIPLGMLAHVQAQLLARHLRGDLDGYPGFIWR